MPENDCQHLHGDQVPDLFGWVCGQCFTVLEDRPKRYGMTPQSNISGDKYLVARQQIIWQAEILKSAEGTTLSVFLGAVAKRFMRKGGLDRESAFSAALDAVKGLDAVFGQADFDWSRASAVDVADEEMTYWDEGPGGENP